MAAVELENKILLFGGHSDSSYTTCFLNKEGGEVVEDLSEDPLTPGAMCRGSYAVGDEKIYVVGTNKVSNDVWDYVFRVFDGKKWS